MEGFIGAILGILQITLLDLTLSGIILVSLHHKEINESPVLLADETLVCVSKDGCPAGAQSYMRFYRTGKMYNASPIVLYEYQKTCNDSYPREFLKDYSGIVVTDRYQLYHNLEKERGDLKIVGCWSHARRRFANVVQALGKEKSK